MKFSLGMLNSIRRILSGFNGVTTTTLGDVALLVKARPVTQQVILSIVEDLKPYKDIMGTSLAALDESYPFNLPPNGQL